MAQGTVLPAFIRAEYDSSSQGFRDLERNAALAGQNIKQQFETSFGEIQSVVQKALSIPRNAAGALDFDTASLRRAADDAQALSVATREVARAAEIAARATGDTSEATRIYVQAARAAATGAETQSRELNAQAATYERLQKEIDQTISSTQRLVTASSSYSIANRGVTESTRAVRQATVQAGQQLQDIVISLQGGQRASTVLAQQLPQLAFAFQGVGGKVGAVATVLSGPWGVAVALAAGALGGLIDNLFRTEDASGKLVLALDIQKNSYAVLKRAVDEYNDSQRQTEELSYQAIKTAKAQAEENLRLAESELAVARARFANQDAGSKGGLEMKSAYGFQVTQIANEIEALRAELGKSTSALISKENQAALDPVVAITRKWDEEIRKVNIAYTKLAATRKLTQQEEEAWRAKELAFEQKKKAAIEAHRKAERDSKRTGGADPTGELTRFINPVTGGRITSTPGIRRDPVNGKQAQHNGVDIAVPVGTQVRAPAGGTIIESGYVPGYGNVVYIDHGAGTVTRLAHLSKRGVAKGDIVGQGDVIGLSGNTGKSTGPHVHWETRVNNRVTDPRGRRLPTDPLGAAQNSVDMVAEGERAAKALQDAIDQAGQSVTRLRGQFDQAPRDIDKANVAAMQLGLILKDVNDTLATADLTKDQRAALEAYRAEIEKIQKVLIPEFLQRPIDDRIKGMDRELQIQKLLLQGREADADLLAFEQDLMRQLNVETKEQLATELKSRGITQDKLDLLYAQFQQIEQNNRIQDRMDRAVLSTSSKLRELDAAYETIVQGITDLPKKGIGALNDVVTNLRNQVTEILARRLTDKYFGDFFAKLEGDIRGKKPIDVATDKYVQSTVRTTDALNVLTQSILSASNTIRGVAANDNIASISKHLNAGKSVDGLPTGAALFGKNAGANSWLDEIVVTAKSGKEDGVFSELKKLNKTTELGLGKNSPLSKSFGGVTEALGGALKGAAIGDMTSGVLKSLGIKQSKLGAQIGGAAGSFLPIPGGEIIGSIIGGTIGGLFKKTPRGFATIGGSGNELSITGSGGNSKSARAAGNEAAGATIDTLDKIAQMLGGTYDASRGKVSIGRSGDSWHVDTTGRGRLKKSQGGLDFNDDYEAAVRAATMDLIKDGVLVGLKASTLRLVQQGKDLDAALQKALDFESVFTRLKQRDDPVGAALDTLDKEFSRLKGIFAEAGASAAEYADLERLYGIERAEAVKEAAARVTASLQSLYDNLTIGDNGRSLRDRLGAAQAAYDPLKARVLAGDKSAYDDFAQAAQSLLEIQRQFSGSQTPYFNLLDEITKITRDRIEAEKNVTALAANRDSPFGPNGKATGANDNAPVVSAIGETNEILRQIGRVIAAGGGGLGGGGFGTNPFL